MFPRAAILRRAVSTTTRSSATGVASSAARSISFLSLPSAQSSPSPRPPDLDPVGIAANFKDWFQSRPGAIFDQIYRICSGPYDPDPALAALNLRLSEELVIKLLHHHRYSENLYPCLAFFDWAGRQPGFHHTRATYHAIFKILSRAKLISVLLDWLRTFSAAHGRGTSSASAAAFSTMEHHVLYRVRFHDTLVMGYAVAGRVDMALQLFGRMRFQGIDLNSFAYHVLLNSVVEERCFGMEDVLLKQIASRGYESLITTCIRLKSLCLQNRVDEAEECLRDLSSSGVAIQEHMLGVVVDARCKQGMFDKALGLVEEFGDASMSRTYGLLINNLIQAGNAKMALDFFKNKKTTENYLPELFCYNKLICWLLKDNRLEEVYNLLTEMMQEGISPDKLTMNAVLRFFCKAGFTNVAIELYKSSLEVGFSLSSLTYNILINSLCGDGSVEEAFVVLEDCIKQGYFPSKMTFFILADKLCADGKLEKMSKLVDMALKRNIMPTTGVWSKYVNALCRSGRVEEAYQVPKLVKKPGFFFNKDALYNLLRGFIELKRGDMASELLVEMRNHGKTPPRKWYKAVVHCLYGVGEWECIRELLQKNLTGNESTDRRLYTCFIDGVSHANHPTFAEELFSKMIVEGIKPSVRTKIVVLKCFLKSGYIRRARGYFEKFAREQTPSIRLYNTMITGYCESNMLNDALSLWTQVRQMGLVPSVQSYEVLVKGLCLSRKYHMVAKVFHDYEQTKRPIPHFMKSTLLFHALKDREFKEYCDLELSLSYPGELLRDFYCLIRSKNLKQLIDAMKYSFEADIFMYNLLLKRLNMAGRIEYAHAVFEIMRKKRIEPNRYSYDIMLHAFCLEGRDKEAKKWIEEMYRKEFCPSPQTQDLYKELMRRSPHSRE